MNNEYDIVHSMKNFHEKAVPSAVFLDKQETLALTSTLICNTKWSDVADQRRIQNTVEHLR